MQQAPAHEELLDLEVRNSRLRHGERRNDGPDLEQVGVVAHLAQLHEHVGNLLVHARVQRRTRLCAAHELVIEEALALGQWAEDQVFVFARQLLLDIALEPAKKIGAKDSMELRNTL